MNPTYIRHIATLTVAHAIVCGYALSQQDTWVAILFALTTLAGLAVVCIGMPE